MNEDRPRFIERVRRAASPDDVRQNRSNAMVTLGVVLFLVAAVAAATNSGEGSPTGLILFGILGTGLVVGGLVIRR